MLEKQGISGAVSTDPGQEPDDETLSIVRGMMQAQEQAEAGVKTHAAAGDLRDAVLSGAPSRATPADPAGPAPEGDQSAGDQAVWLEGASDTLADAGQPGEDSHMRGASAFPELETPPNPSKKSLGAVLVARAGSAVGSAAQALAQRLAARLLPGRAGPAGAEPASPNRPTLQPVGNTARERPARMLEQTQEHTPENASKTSDDARLIDRILAFRPTRKQIALALLVAFVIWRPWLIPGLLFLLFWVVLIVHFSLGPDRVSELVTAGWEWFERRYPARAEPLLGKIQRGADRVDGWLASLPEKWTDGIYLPDFRRSQLDDGNCEPQPDPFDRLARERKGAMAGEPEQA